MRAFDKLAISMPFRKVLLLCAALLAVSISAARAHARYSAPAITQITPSSYEFGIPHPGSGSYETQVVLTIQGTGFRKGARAYFNGRRVTTQWISKIQITATIPGDWLRAIPNKLITPNIPADGMVGNAKIRVRNPGHGGTSRAFLFPVTATPIE